MASKGARAAGSRECRQAIRANMWPCWASTRCAGAKRTIASAASVLELHLSIGPDALHTQPAGSREAVRWFTAYLDEWPGDLRVRWLLNIASMTLGEHPQGPAAVLIPSGRSARSSTWADLKTSPGESA